LAEHVATQAAFLDTKLKPCLDAVQAGDGHVFFVDAAHFVFGTFLCCLWSFTRIFVRAASGRQRFNVLGAWNAVTHELIAVTNTTVVNTATISELLRKIAGLGLTGPITLVLDNARYQHNAAVKALAQGLGITLLFLPSYSPNLNLIERLWKFTKRRALYGRYHPTFREFQAAIQETLDRGFPWTETPSQFKGDRLRFLAGFEDNPRSRVRGFLGGNASRDLFFRLNIPPNVQEAAQLHSQFFLTPTAREGTTLALSAAINAIGDRHPRRNPLTSRSPGRGRLLLPPLLPGARRHPSPTL